MATKKGPCSSGGRNFTYALLVIALSLFVFVFLQSLQSSDAALPNVNSAVSDSATSILKPMPGPAGPDSPAPPPVPPVPGYPGWTVIPLPVPMPGPAGPDSVTPPPVPPVPGYPGWTVIPLPVPNPNYFTSGYIATALRSVHGHGRSPLNTDSPPSSLAVAPFVPLIVGKR